MIRSSEQIHISILSGLALGAESAESIRNNANKGK